MLLAGCGAGVIQSFMAMSPTASQKMPVLMKKS
jgi:hypothetical protein